MRATLVAGWLAAFALSACAAGQYVVLDPPSRFDKPYPNLRVDLHHPRAIDRECRNRWPGNASIRGRIVGCAVLYKDGRCDLILPHDYSERLYRHERAHCHGWVHGYP